MSLAWAVSGGLHTKPMVLNSQCADTNRLRDLIIQRLTKLLYLIGVYPNWTEKLALREAQRTLQLEPVDLRFYSGRTVAASSRIE